MQRARWPAAVAALMLGVLVASSASSAEAQRRRRRREPAQLTIQTDLEGAEVLIDEESVGFTPLERAIELSPGTHTVRVRRPGYTEFTDVVRVRAGQRVELPVDLLALAMVLTVRSTPDQSRVFVDGTFRGTTPIELELIEGEHSIRVTRPNHTEVVREVTARAGTTDLLAVTLEPLSPEELGAEQTTEWYEEPAVWISVGAGAAVVAVVIIVAAVLAQGGSQLADYCGGAEEMTCLRVAPEWQWPF